MAFPLGVHEADPQPGAVHIQHAHGRAGRKPVHARAVVSGTPAESGSAILGGRGTGAKHAAMHPTCGVAQSDREPAAGLPGDPHQTRTVAGLKRNDPDDPAGRRLADIFRFEDRENAARTREGLAGVETRSRRKSRGQDFDFVLSRDGRTMTVSIRKRARTVRPAMRSGRGPTPAWTAWNTRTAVCGCVGPAGPCPRGWPPSRPWPLQAALRGHQPHRRQGAQPPPAPGPLSGDRRRAGPLFRRIHPKRAAGRFARVFRRHDRRRLAFTGQGGPGHRLVPGSQRELVVFLLAGLQAPCPPPARRPPKRHARPLPGRQETGCRRCHGRGGRRAALRIRPPAVRSRSWRTTCSRAKPPGFFRARPNATTGSHPWETARSRRPGAACRPPGPGRISRRTFPWKPSPPPCLPPKRPRPFRPPRAGNG